MYCTIRVHFQYGIFCTRYDAYRISYDTDNYVHLIKILRFHQIRLFGWF